MPLARIVGIIGSVTVNAADLPAPRRQGSWQRADACNSHQPDKDGST